MSAIDAIKRKVENTGSFIPDILAEAGKSIIGKTDKVRLILSAFLCGGHVLIEGMPGLAKTKTVNALAMTMDLEFGRIQFTPDLMPSDITGTMIFSRTDEAFKTRKGPIFKNIILADEINRAPAKVQSALLEAMQERTVTIGENTHKLPYPFFVCATQNPIDQDGTFDLPSAQKDRFMIKIKYDYPAPDEEKSIVSRPFSHEKIDIAVMADRLRIASAIETVKEIYCDPKINEYIVAISNALRFPTKYDLKEIENYLDFGPSPRGSMALAMMARAYAFSLGKAYVTPEDILAIADSVLAHRIGPNYRAYAEKVSAEELIKIVLEKVKMP